MIKNEREAMPLSLVEEALRRGREALGKSEFEAARLSFGEACILLQNLPQHNKAIWGHLLGEALAEQAFCLFVLERPQEANESYVSCLDLLGELCELSLQHLPQYIKILQAYGGFLKSSGTEGDSFKTNGLNALALCKRAHVSRTFLPLESALYFNRLGNSFYDAEMRTEELEAYNLAVESLELSGVRALNENISAIYSNRGETLLALNRLAESERDYNKSFAMLYRLFKTKKLEEPLAFFGVGYNYFSIRIALEKDLNSLLREINSLIKILQAPKYNKEPYLEFLFKLSVLRCYTGNTLGKPKKELRFCNKLIELCQSRLSGNKEQLLMAYELRARAYVRQGKHYKAALDFKSTAQYSMDAEIPSPYKDKRTFNLLFHSANSFDESGDYSSAKEQFSCIINRTEAIENHREDEDFAEGLSLAYFRRGVDWTRIEEHNYAKAAEDHRKSLSILEGRPDTPEKWGKLSEVYSSYAQIFEVFGELELAKEYFEKAKSSEGKVK
ncbi:MAG: hypothetical protein LBS74_08045 [Oscillospiraceae bacterium]|jgi:tetratricopeptide (TPR) repeat protein|nr:hypothetical protein [Oscillospiraceae bacterium]